MSKAVVVDSPPISTANQKGRVVDSSPNGYIYKTIPTPKAQEIVHKRWKDCKSQKAREFAVRLYLLVISEATPIKSHQHDCLNMSWTRMAAMHMPNWTEKSPRGLKLTQKTQVTKGSWE